MWKKPTFPQYVVENSAKFRDFSVIFRENERFSVLHN